jgi:hypothetical protein
MLYYKHQVMKGIGRVILLAFLFFAGNAVPAHAVLYKYVDEHGATVVTSDKQSIPEKYDNRVEVIDEKASSDGFSPEGKLADEIRQKREEGGTEGRFESSDARWYKENPEIEPSAAKRLLLYIRDLWNKIPFETLWPVIAAALGVIAAFVVSRFIISRSQRRLLMFFSVLTASTFVLVMYALVLK